MIRTRVPAVLFLVLSAVLAGCERRPASPPSDAASGAAIFHVDDAPGDNDRDRIRNALSAVRDVRGPAILRFSPREYLVRPESLATFEPVIGAAGITNLTIEGQGATLVAVDALDCEKGYFFKISRFENLVVRDLTLTHRPLPIVQGTIVRTEQESNLTTVALQPGFDHLDRLRETPHAKLWCRVGLPEDPLRPKPGSPSWLDVGMDQNRHVRAVAGDPGQVTLHVGGFSLDATLNGEFNWKAGDPIVLWKRGAQDGFCFEDGRDLVLENVRVESALHYAIKLRGIVNATLRECHVTPSAGAMLSSSADGIDVQQSRRVTIERCSLVATGDDAISLLNHAHGLNGTHFEEKFPPPFPETNHNAYLARNHAVCVTHGVFGSGRVACTDVVIRDNEILSHGAWATPDEAIFVHGAHENVVIERNLLRDLDSSD